LHAGAYFLLDPTQGHTCSPDGELVFSVTSFHERGVQPPGLPLTGTIGDNLATLSALEAIFGLLIEGLFIAAFTRRFTGGQQIAATVANGAAVALIRR
jgi:hypothetical protein